MSVIIKNLISNRLFKENNEQETYHFELACKQSFEKWGANGQTNLRLYHEKE
jgi:hypothetical protein